MWLLNLAHASCMAQPESTYIVGIDLAPDQPVMAGSTWGSGEDLARRLRLRGPDGGLVPIRREVLGLDARLVPEQPLEPGTYTVEERGAFDADGQRVYRGTGHHQGWFATSKLQVTPAVRTTTQPLGVEWMLQGQRGSGLLAARAAYREPGAWTEMEVKGVGPVAVQRLHWNDAWLLTTHAAVRCNDTGRRAPLGAGDVEARVVAYGPAGWTASSAWSLVGPGSARSTRPGLPPLAGPPSGTPADVSGLATWSPIDDAVPTAPVQTDAIACGSLVHTGKTELSDTSARIGADGAMHLVRTDDDGTRIDGSLFPDLEGHVQAVLGHQGSLFLVETGLLPKLVRYDGTVRTHTYVVPSEGAFQLTLQGDRLVLSWTERSRHRWTQPFSLTLEPIEPPTEVLFPIQVHHAGNGDLMINGRSVGGRYLQPWVWDEHVAVASRDERREDVAITVYDARGRQVNTVPLPEDVRVERIAVDSRGVSAVVRDRSTHQPRNFGADWSGRARTVVDVPSPRSLNPRRSERYPFGEATVVVEGMHLAVRDAQGHFTAPIPVSRGKVGVDGDTIVVARSVYVEGANHLRLDRYACGGGPLGVPLRWLP